MAFSDELTAILSQARQAPPPEQPDQETLRKHATRAAIWLARHGHDDRHDHGVKLAYYLACCELKHSAATKGLCLSGQCGTGKTVALRLLAKWTGAHYLTASLAVELYRANPQVWEETIVPALPTYSCGETYWPDLVIDDLGAEPTAASYGQKSEAMAGLVDLRDAYYQKRGGRLHVATNLVQSEIEARYGQRTLSRLLGMCHWREWGGEDGRTAAVGAK